MSNWGRKEYPSWPSRNPVWSWGALFAAVLFFVVCMLVQYVRSWSFVEKFYLPIYVKTAVRGFRNPKSQARYQLLAVVDAKKQQRIALDGEVDSKTQPDGKIVYVLTDEAKKNGFVRLAWDDEVFNDKPLHEYLAHWIYQDQTFWDYVQRPVYGAAGLFVFLLFFALPKDRKNAMERKNGRRLRGPELLRTAEFNARQEADGMAFINEEQTRMERLLKNNASRWARVPRQREAMHFLVMGDSGSGKSAAIRQILIQAQERGESAIVYDPALEYVPQFYLPARGDVILNPVDARCPFWTPGDEVPHEAEALTLAASLFPEQGRDNRFFVEAPRKIFAHLLNLKPTPEELTYWMCHPEEIDRRVKGTEMAAMIDPHAAQQRNGVLGSLNMVADAFKLLPRERETERRWSTVEWAKERKSWVFLTSRPTMRERVRPLLSLWLDLLVLRLMNEGHSGTRPVWFVLDELASLQRLPQLLTAITENRKSNNPMVLGFQGKAQLEVLYGQIAEVMLSQPATKIFLKTSEPNAAEWISKAIGQVEIERYRETRTHGQFPQSRNSESEQRDIQREPLVMAEEISGLDPLHGYLKYGNLVVQMKMPYIELQNTQLAFVEREAPPEPPAAPAPDPKPSPEPERGRGAAANDQSLFFE
jgi:type IV secretory pathway TraG/TraD family ATPase VirD4